MSAPKSEGFVNVDGCPIHYLAWGEEGAPGIVLVHGSMANAHWWSHIAPVLATNRRVVAVDLSGHGDSGHRSTYTIAQWATEVRSVADVVGIGGPTVFVGHSVGGHVAAQAANIQSDLVAGVVVFEMPIPELNSDTAEPKRASFGRRLYPSPADALTWFRPVLPQDHWLDYVAENIVGNSITPRDGQWGWKFDPEMFGPQQRLANMPDLTQLAKLTCPLAVLIGDGGHPSADGAEALAKTLGRPVYPIQIPDSGHNPMLDQPVALVVALRCILSSWMA